MFELGITHSALGDLQHLRKDEQKRILDEIERKLLAAPLTTTRNRKPLRPNDLSEWEMRAGKYRVFYEVDVESNLVTIKAVGWKEHNKLFIRGREFVL